MNDATTPISNPSSRKTYEVCVSVASSVDQDNDLKRKTSRSRVIDTRKVKLTHFLFETFRLILLATVDKLLIVHDPMLLLSLPHRTVFKRGQHSHADKAT